MDPELFERVRRLVARETGVRPERIRPESTLFGDLGVDGDDADELFEAFAAEFRVDLGPLQLSRHFGGEGIALGDLLRLPALLWRLARGVDPHDAAGKVPIRVADMVRAAELGRWAEPTAPDGEAGHQAPAI